MPFNGDKISIKKKKEKKKTIKKKIPSSFNSQQWKVKVDRSLHRSTIYRRLNVDDDLFDSHPPITHKGEGKGENAKKKEKRGKKKERRR